MSSRTSTALSRHGSSDPSIDVPQLLDHYRAGRLDVTALVSRQIGLEEIDTAFAEMLIGSGARNLIRFDA